MLHVKCILHPTDHSDHANYAWSVACALARDYGARIVLLHVAPLAVIGGPELMPSPQTIPDLTALKASHEAGLLKVQPTDPNIHVDRYVIFGDPATEILQLAQDTSCDLVVMGTHGRTGLSRILMGSVAETVIRKATCPVLVVKLPLSDKSNSQPVS